MYWAAQLQQRPQKTIKVDDHRIISIITKSLHDIQPSQKPSGEGGCECKYTKVKPTYSRKEGKTDIK